MTPHLHPSVVLGLVLTTGCDSAPACPPGFLDLEGTCTFDEGSVLELVRTMDEGVLVKANSEPFIQVTGVSIERNVWISQIEVPEMPELDSLDLYLSIDPYDASAPLAAEFPVGTVLIHEAVNREEGHGVQVKRDDYENLVGGDWWFGKVYDDGTYDINACSPCEQCHDPAPREASEGLWGIPEEAI